MGGAGELPKRTLRGFWLAVLIVAVAACCGCRPSSRSEVDGVGPGLAWYPRAGASVVGSEGPAIDWDRAFDELPEPAFGSEYYRYNRAVSDILRQAYAADRRVMVEGDPLEDMSRAHFEYAWGRFPTELEGPEDPFLGEASCGVGFAFTPAAPEASAYAAAGEIFADQRFKWDLGKSRTEGEEKRSRVLGASLRIWRLAVGRFMPVGDEFWSAFDALQSLAVAGYLPNGQWDLPGTHGGDIRLAMGVGDDALDGYCHMIVNLQPLAPASGQAGEVVSEPGAWVDAVAGLPPTGFGDRFTPFFEGLITAVRQCPSGDADVLVSLVETPVSEDVRQVTLRWLRPAPPDGSGFRLEILTLNLTAETSGSGGAQAVEVMELLAWDSKALSQAAGGSSPAEPGYPPIQALAPARDVALGRYLPLGAEFTTATANLNLVKGLGAELPGRDGAAILLSVSDFSWAPGASVVRYTLTVVEDGGG